MRSSTKIAILFIALCAAILLVWSLHPRPKPPATAIADQLDSAVSAANAHSPGGVMSIISNDYGDDNNMTATSLRVLLARGLGNANNARTVMTTPGVSVSGDTATSDCTLTVTGAGGETYFNRPVHLTWRQEPGRAWLVFPLPVWRVVHADYGEAIDYGQ